MKKNFIIALVLLSSMILSARETKVLPILTTDDYSFTPGIALVGGYGSYNGVDGSAMYGLELSFACPLLQLSTLDIKQQISLVHQKKGGFSATSLEFNPHVMFDITKDIQFGVGPEFGVIFAKNIKKDTVYNVGAGISLNYDLSETMFVGLETRYQWTTNAEINYGANDDLDNARTLLKVGMRF